MFRFALLAAAEAAVLDVTWKDCGAKHATVTDVSPSSIHTGATETITGTGTTDEEVTSAQFTATVSALGTKLTDCSGDATSDITCTLPMSVGKIVVKAVSYPLAQGTVKIPVDVQTSSIIPPSLASVDVHIAANDQNGESVICLDVHTDQEKFENIAAKINAGNHGSPSPSPTPTPLSSPSASCPHGWKEATWTAYESWPRCCKGNDNYDAKAPTDECTEDNGCKWAGQFAYHQCNGKDVCPLDWVESTNIVSFFTTNGEHKHYKDKKIRVQARGQTVEVRVTDTCGDSDCHGCCTKNAKKHGGSLIDMEFYTVARYWPDIKEPEENLLDMICWQPIAQAELV